MKINLANGRCPYKRFHLTRCPDSRRHLWRQGKIDKLTHELAMHKRWRFGVKTEHWPVEQRQLFEETIDADLAAIEEELSLSPDSKINLSSPGAYPEDVKKPLESQAASWC